EVQLAVVKAQRRPDQLGDGVDDGRLLRQPRVERIVIGRILDAPEDRRGRGVTRVEVEDAVAPGHATGALDEGVGHPAQRVVALRVEWPRYGEVAVSVGGRYLLGRQEPDGRRRQCVT